MHRPELCLLGWCVLFTTGLLAAVVGTGWVVVLGISARLRYDRQLVRTGTLEPTAHMMAGWLALALSGGVLGLVGTKVAAMVVLERRTRRRFTRLASASSTRHSDIAGLTVHVVSGGSWLACSLRRTGSFHRPGREVIGEVLLSRSVVEQLDPPQLAALLAHERAHLRGRHDLILRIAALNADCLPGFVTSAAMQRSTRLLIELIADRAAARDVGAGPIAAALSRLSEVTSTETLALRAELLVAGRPG